jgi:glutamate-1-semialdehyde 2,1-aminomutase
VFAAAGLAVLVPRIGTLVGIHCSATPAVDYATAKTTDTELYKRFFHGMLSRGVALAPGAYEVLFPGLSHDDAVIDEIVARAATAVASL